MRQNAEHRVPPPTSFFCHKKSKHAGMKVENKNSSPRTLKQNVHSNS